MRKETFPIKSLQCAPICCPFTQVITTYCWPWAAVVLNWMKIAERRVEGEEVKYHLAWQKYQLSSIRSTKPKAFPKTTFVAIDYVGSPPHPSSTLPKTSPGWQRDREDGTKWKQRATKIIKYKTCPSTSYSKSRCRVCRIWPLAAGILFG